MKLTIFYPDGLRDVFTGVDQDDIDKAGAMKVFYLEREDFVIAIPFTAIRTFEYEEETD